MDYGRIILKLLGLGLSVFDVVTGILNGINFLTPRYVTKLIDLMQVMRYQETVSQQTVLKWFARKQKWFWGILTLSCIQVPGLVMCIFLCATRYSADSGRLIQMALLLVPYPLIAWVQLIWSILIDIPLSEHFSALLLLGEGALESAPQLILQNYIILTDKTRTPDNIQCLAIITSYVCIAKTTIEMYASRSADYLHRPTTSPDSMLEHRSFLQKIWILLKISPSFLTSLLIKVFSKL